MYQVVGNQPASSNEVLNLNELIDRCMGKLEFAQRLLKRFEAQLDSDIDLIKQAASSQDLEFVAQVAHRVKGASANVSAVPLMKVAAEIETAARDGDADTLWSRLPILAAERDRFKKSVPQFDQPDATP